MDPTLTPIRPAEGAAARPAPAARRCDVDWLRVFAVLLVIPLHVGLAFGMRLESIPVVEAPRGDAMAVLAGLIYPWHMPLLFLLSGVSSCYALRAQGARRFLVRRATRLLPPLVFAITVLIPPLAFVRFLGQPGWPKSYLAFYPRFYLSIAPSGAFTWLHMWFVAYLMIYTILLIPIHRWRHRVEGRRAVAWIPRVLDRPGGILILALPLAAVEIAFRGRWPGVQNLVDDLANVVRYLTLFLYGAWIAADERLAAAVRRSVGPAVAAGVVTSGALIAQWTLLRIPAPSYSLPHAAGLFLWAVNGWAWLVVLLGLGERHLQRGGRALRYLSEASLPVYVLHLPITVGISAALAGTGLPTAAAFPAAVAGSFVGIGVIYESVVRRFRIMRWLLGMGGRRRSAE